MEGHFTLSQQVGMEVGAVICHFLKWPFCPPYWSNDSINPRDPDSPRYHKYSFREEASIEIYLVANRLQGNDKWGLGWVPTRVEVKWIDLLDGHKTVFRTTILTGFSQDENGIWQFASGHSEERIV